MYFKTPVVTLLRNLMPTPWVTLLKAANSQDLRVSMVAKNALLAKKASLVLSGLYALGIISLTKMMLTDDSSFTRSANIGMLIGMMALLFLSFDLCSSALNL